LTIGRFRITSEERTATVVGIVIWAVWYVGVSVLLSMAAHDQGTSDLVLSPFFRWMAFGPFLAFLFLGRHIMRFNMKMATGSLSNMSNVVTSATSFMAWGLVLLVWDCFFGGVDTVPALVFGMLFTYLMLVVSNGRWNP